MFYGCKNLKEFKEVYGYKLIDFTNVKDISYMFKDCETIKNIDFDLFKGIYRVNKMECLFFNCTELIF